MRKLIAPEDITEVDAGEGITFARVDGPVYELRRHGVVIGRPEGYRALMQAVEEARPARA